MKTKHSKHDHVRRFLGAAGITLTAFAAGCGGDPEVTAGGSTTVAAYPDDYYAYGYYYPADLAYSVPYYVDDWYNYPYLYSDTQPLTDATLNTPGGLLRALAKGEDVCPDQVTMTPVEMEVACGGGKDGMIRTGASVTIEDCKLENGGKLSAHFELQSRRSFSNSECDIDTVIDLAFSGVYTDVVYTKPDGARIEVPKLTFEGAYTRLFPDPPAAVSITVSGSFEQEGTRVNVSGSFGAILGAPSDDWSYQLFGPLRLKDDVTGNAVTARALELAHRDDCCHPTGGQITVSSAEAQEDLVEFGPTCGLATLNGDQVELPDCE